MRLTWTLAGIASAVALLGLLKCILSPEQDDEEHRLDDDRTHRDYSQICPPVAPSTSKQYRRYRDDDDDRTLLPPARSNMDSRGNLNPSTVVSHGGGNQTLYSSTGSSEKPIASTPFSSSSSSAVIRVSSNPSPVSKPSHALTNINASAVKLSIGPDKLQITKDSVDPLPSKFHVPSIPSSAASARSSKNPSLSAVASTGKISDVSFSGEGDRVWRKKEQPLTASIRESQQNIYSAFPSSIKAPDFSSPSPTPHPLRSNRRVLSKYEIPKYLEEMIKKDIVPPILKSPLLPSTYADYFASLLYAEDFYIEKWSNYLLEDVALELRPRDDHSQTIDMKRKSSSPVRKDFIAFKLEDVHERRPFLLSRDFVFLRPLKSSAEPFKGILFRVVRGIVLVEFGEDFHSQHSPSKRYDVSFSFNRVCLKRAHQAISISADPSFHSILFPDMSLSPQLHDRTLSFQDSARRIANHWGPIPFLLQGQLVTEKSPTGRLLQLAMLNIYRANPRCRILVCSPTNNTSDVLLRSLRERIPEASFFRANAAFRDYELVPDDIVPASLYEEEQECFACPPLSDLLDFNIVACTFMSSFRLSSAGIGSDHFSHMFLVDACLVVEPEAIVPLANLACGDTVLVVSGCLGKSPLWVRSEIARANGLKMSYFSRLLERQPYRSGDAMFTLLVPND